VLAGEVVLVGEVVPVDVVVPVCEDVLLPCEPLLLGVVVVPEPDVWVDSVEPETLPVYEIVEVSSENVVVA